MMIMRRQAGMSIWGIIAVLLMLGFFAMCIIRIVPVYSEFLSVRDVISRLAMNPETRSASPGQIKRNLGLTFNTNQIRDVDYQDVRIFDKSGKRYIDARYEVRLPVMWRLDMVVKFDDLLYQVGENMPVTDPALLRRK